MKVLAKAEWSVDDSNEFGGAARTGYHFPHVPAYS
jgi:hypothetical protein